jgi:hypothetical protein
MSVQREPLILCDGEDCPECFLMSGFPNDGTETDDDVRCLAEREAGWQCSEESGDWCSICVDDGTMDAAVGSGPTMADPLEMPTGETTAITVNGDGGNVDIGCMWVNPTHGRIGWLHAVGIVALGGTEADTYAAVVSAWKKLGRES